MKIKLGILRCSVGTALQSCPNWVDRALALSLHWLGGVFRYPLKGKLRWGERGQALVLALIVLGFGSLMMGGLMTYLNASILAHGKAVDRTEAYYAADAGVEAIISDLLQDKDPEVGLYSWSGGAINGFTPSVTIVSIIDKDYDVTSTAGDVTINCKLCRKLWKGETFVTILSWETS